MNVRHGGVTLERLSGFGNPFDIPIKISSTYARAVVISSLRKHQLTFVDVEAG